MENTASDPRVKQCPALIGPSELARWDITFDFANRRLTVKGQPQEMELSNTRHPVLTMVEDGRCFAEWKTPALEELKERLTKDPYRLAMLQESLPNPEEESESEPEVRTAVMAVEVGEEKEVQELAEWQAELETVAIHEMDKVMATLPPGALVEGAMPTSESSDSEGSLSEAETETSHDAVNEAESESSTSEDEEWERHEVMTATIIAEETEVLNKGQRRRLLDAVHKISEAANDEVEARKQQRQSRKSKLARPLGPLLRVIEVFTWSCMLSMTAVDRGGWEAYEPITLDSGWDVRVPGIQDAAMKYLERIDPDLVVVAWPCGPWSIMQNAN